jgi:hypothetical protein
VCVLVSLCAAPRSASSLFVIGVVLYMYFAVLVLALRTRCVTQTDITYNTRQSSIQSVKPKARVYAYKYVYAARLRDE